MAVAGPMALEVAFMVCHLYMAGLAICRWLAVPSDTYHMTYITSTDQRVASGPTLLIIICN